MGGEGGGEGGEVGPATHAERRRLKGKTALARAIPDITQLDDHFYEVESFLYKALKRAIKNGDDKNGLSDSGDQMLLLSHFVWGRGEAVTAKEGGNEDSEGDEGSLGEEEQGSKCESISSDHEYWGGGSGV